MNEDLIQKAQQGDQAAYGDLFLECYPRIVAAAEKILGNEADAEEIAPDVFMKGIETFDPNGAARFDTWLLGKITLNACRDRIRRNKAKKRNVGEQDEGSDEHLTAKNTALPDSDEDGDEDPRYWKIEGGPPIGERDQFLQVLIAKEKDPHVLALRKIESWPDDTRRKHAFRIVTDERIASFSEELRRAVEGKGVVTMSHFILVLMWAADCSEPYEEVFTPEEARATLKVLEYFGGKFHDAPAGSGFEAIHGSIETLVKMIRPTAERKGTKTITHQYDLIGRLDLLFSKICGSRLPDTAIRILLEITYGGKWTSGKLAGMRVRAREVFQT